MDSRKQAQGIASLGRYGDTTLMHMRPDEVAGLTAISRANGGDITINPDTGMPEAFLGDFFSALAPTAAGIGAGALFGPAGGAFAGGLTSYLQGKRDPLSIGMGALGGYGGGNIGANLVATAPTSVAPAATSNISNAAVNTTQGVNMSTGDIVGNIASTTAEQNIVPAGINMSSGEVINAPGTQGLMTGAPPPPNIAQGPNIDTTMGAKMGQVNIPDFPDRPVGYDFGLTPENLGASDVAVQSNLPSPKSPFESGFEYAQNKFGKLAEGTKSVFTDEAKRGEFFGRMGGAEYDNLGNLTKAGNETYGMIKTGLPLAGAGMEAYAKNQYDNLPKMGEVDKYDPYATLNLSQPTGLQLLAKGGSVKRYQAGGTTAMQNAYGLNTPSVPAPVGSQGLSSLNLTTPTADLNKKMNESLMKGEMNQLTPEEKEEIANMTPEEIYAKYGAVMEGQTTGMNVAQPITQPITQPLAEPMSNLSLSDEQANGEGEEGGEQMAKGGRVRGYATGGETSANYGVDPDYSFQIGRGQIRNPVMGNVGVGGEFIPDPQGSISDIEYEREYSAMWDPQDKYGAYNPDQFASPSFGQAGGRGGNIGNIIAAAAPVASNVVSNIQNAPSESQSLGTLEGEKLAKGGRVKGYMDGGISELTPEDGKYLNGNGDGVSDDIPAMIEGEQEAALSDGEFIVPARIVSELGNGSSDAGAKKLYTMIDRIQAARKQTIGNDKQYAKDTNAERYLPA